MRHFITVLALVALAAPMAHAAKHRVRTHHGARRHTAHAAAPVKPAPAAPPEQRANAALADFALAYADWQNERQCDALDRATQTTYLQAIDEDVAGLAAVFGKDIVAGVALAAAAPAGGCINASEDGRIGLAIALQVGAALKALPPDYKAPTH